MKFHKSQGQIVSQKNCKWSAILLFPFQTFHEVKFYITTKQNLIVYCQRSKIALSTLSQNLYGVRFCSFYFKPSVKLQFYITTKHYQIVGLFVGEQNWTFYIIIKPARSAILLIPFQTFHEVTILHHHKT